jgi:hypothetical protein
MFALLKCVGAAAAMILASGAETANKEQVPIYLVAERAAEGLRLRVIGSSHVPFEAAFSLEVTSSGNHSVHRGSAMLDGGEARILSTVTLGNADPGKWLARLRVEPRGGKAYEQVRDAL